MKYSPKSYAHYSSSKSPTFIPISPTKIVGWTPEGEYRIVYILEADNRIKIGITTSYIGRTLEECVQKRIRGYQTGSPIKINIKYFIKTKYAYEIEQIMHSILNEYNCDYGGGTEWFENISLDKIIFILDYIRDCFDYIDYEETKSSKVISYLPTIYDMSHGPMIIEFDF